MAKRENGSAVDFITKRCHIHGRFGDKVYRRKRNGELWIYDYVYKPKYDSTVLSRRTDCIVRMLSRITNLRKKEFRSIYNKLLYYTPYFVYAGSYDLTSQSFLKISRTGEYQVKINDIRLIMSLAPRSPLKLVFDPGKNYLIKCSINDKSYSQREVFVIDESVELEGVYEQWYAEHLEEVLCSPDPRFPALKLYHRGIEPPVWINSFWGKTEKGIVYRSSIRQRFMYTRQPYKHVHNRSTDHFYISQRKITTCWDSASVTFKQVLNKYCHRWFDDNYRQTEKIVKVHNLWSKLIFLAGRALSFDLENISPDNWLPGVKTLGDLITVCGYCYYGLTVEELDVVII